MAQQITSQEFDTLVLQAKGKVLVDFFATWCGPCKMMAPVLDSVNEELGDKGVIYKVDIDQELSLAQRFNIMSVPTLVLFEDGKPVQQLIGLQSAPAISQLFN